MDDDEFVGGLVFWFFFLWFFEREDLGWLVDKTKENVGLQGMINDDRT